jgi:hypothetical protein
MAYEPPKQVDFANGLVLKGVEQWKRYLNFKRGWVKLDPEIRRAFPSDRMVNEALRKVIELRKSLGRPLRNRKSA